MRLTLLAGLGFGLAGLLPSEGVAQTPIGSEFLAHDELRGGQFFHSLVFLPDGSLIMVWHDAQKVGPDQIETSNQGRRLDPGGKPGTTWLLERDAIHPLVAKGFQVPGEFRVFSYRSDPLDQSQFHGALFSGQDGSPLDPPFDVGIVGIPAEINAAVILPNGGSLVTWVANEADPEQVCCRFVARARAFGPDNLPLSDPFLLAPDVKAEHYPFSLATLPDGTAVATLEVVAEGGLDSEIYLVRFSVLGQILGDRNRVNDFTAGFQDGSRIAVAPDGGFVVIWESQLQDGDFEGIYGQRFAPDGSKLGPEFLVNVITRSAQRNPDLAMDPHGNFVVVWASFDPFGADGAGDWNLFARLFRNDGTPVTGEIPVARSHMLEELPRVAFGPLGVFAVAWESYLYDPEFGDVAARRFLASEGAEPCLVNEGKLRCDAGHTGGSPELERGMIGLAKGSTALLGDLDGDGRDDLCARSGARFLCDLNHQGHRAELDLAYGLLSDTPLLGDLDGDGRDDPCVRRGNRILCDTAHNGGNHELALRFGFGGDQALIGDIDGDGRDEACVFRSGRFLCDTAHNGGAAELAIAFGLPGDIALLGDFDADGRDDSCAFRTGHFLCDTAHDGGAAEADLLLEGTGQPLIGNLDGL